MAGSPTSLAHDGVAADDNRGCTKQNGTALTQL
jgi:hypothetical protein